MHVDMDAFYASIEQRDAPELRGHPVIVAGSATGRGVVAAASYEARKFGVRSAMPTRTALRLCPTAIRVPPRHDHYAAVSREIRAVFHEFTDLVEPLALDEAFLDLTAYCEQHESTMEVVARSIKRAIRERVGLTASAGAAPCKFVAKVASDLRKPDGLVVVKPGQVKGFLAPLPVERLWGVGPVTARRFHELGLTTIAQVAACEPAFLEGRFGKAGHEFWLLAQGIDDRPVEPNRDTKSVSAETTFAVDQDLLEPVLGTLAAQAAEVSERLRAHRWTARTVVLKLRYGDFTTLTRSLTPGRPVGETEEIYALASRLLTERTEFPRRAIRLIGVGVSGILEPDAPVQLELFETY